MTPNTQPSSGLSNSKPAPVDRVKQLAATLLSQRGEASGAQVARELHHVLRALDPDDRHSFQRYLATEFQPDKAALRAAAERYLADGTPPAAVLEKLIAYEAVHEIKGWDDLRRRLAPDRHCFAFFHPALPGEPLIFVEVALVEGLATAVP